MSIITLYLAPLLRAGAQLFCLKLATFKIKPYLCTQKYKEQNMEALKTTFNPIQLHILEMFNYCNSEKAIV